ncbi:methanogen output domain 1-containing protein [Pseudooceanicola sp.]|uniref:methanogen output domain 1-containing protein n=1 Tax=Pseudooceanicola sp. TaxID=1914328 RepID=UPI0035C75CA5
MSDRSVADGVAPGPPGDAPGREEFLNTLVGSLAETIENVVGIEDAEAFIGIVGRRMGQSETARIPGAGTTDPARVAEHLKAFKANIGGDFVIESVEGSRITFTNSKCPFARQASGRPSLCMMTTNVFGRVAADATGYARVNVEEALARGDHRCRVTVDLEWDGAGDGKEFYG